MTSAPVFFKYDDTTRDTFIEAKDYRSLAQDGFCYGSFYPRPFQNHDAAGNPTDIVYLITIDSDGVGGIPQCLFIVFGCAGGGGRK